MCQSFCLAFSLPSWPEIASALPVIASLILIEGLLSVDNAMAIAAMASNLPKEQQKLALRLGIVGAYAFRAVCLLLVAWIAGNLWLKALGALYLVYLMCEHVTHENDDRNRDGVADVKRKGLIATIIQIEVMDLSLSLDNVVAAVALDRRLWVVCLGVFIGILTLRFVAGYCIALIKRLPILKKTAFLLVGFVGAILLTELSAEYAHAHLHVSSFQKFLGIMAIIAMSVAYAHTERGRRFLSPVVLVGMPVLRGVNKVLGVVLLPFALIAEGIRRIGSSMMPKSVA